MVSKKKEKTTCENIEKTFINETLNTHTPITIDRANILGKPKVTGNRPVVKKCHSYKEREQVRQATYEKLDTLRAGHLGASVQQTKAVLQKRRGMK